MYVSACRYDCYFRIAKAMKEDYSDHKQKRIVTPLVIVVIAPLDGLASANL